MDEATRIYLQRWRAVREIELQEMAGSSFDLRWQQLNALFNLASALGILTARDEDQENQYIERWARLKRDL
jgi:hypothetical protein